MKNLVQRIYLLCLFMAFSGLAIAADIPNNTIYYTSTDGKIVTPYNHVFGANIISNTYEDGQGIITFDGDITSIGNSAFYNRKNLTSITIPNSVTSIEEYAFWVCSGLTSVTIPSSVTSIGDYAFSHCSGLTFVTIPSSVTSIGDYAFSHCSSLTFVTIPNSVTSIGFDAFYDCNSLTSIVIPNSVTSIGTNAFTYCSGLKSVTISNSVTKIEQLVFSNCSGLTSITIPNSVEFIGYGAFWGCSGLKSVTISNSVKSIGVYAFKECNNLTSITNYSTTPQIVSSNTFSEYGTLHVLPGCKETYENAEVWKNFTIIEDAVDESTMTINYTSSDGKIITPNASGFGVKIISNTYENGQGTITFDREVTKIQGWAFGYSCPRLTSITITSSVTSINDFAFAGCSGLTSIIIPNSVTNIGNAAFLECSNLTSITIPNSVTSIGWGIFSNCTGLTSVIVDKNNTKYDCRNDCNAIIETATNTLIAGCKNTVIPNSVACIGSSAFSGCSGLTSITIPNSVACIGNSAFSGCSGLTSITIPNSVTSIEDYAFSGCSRLTSITIPNSVTSIEDYAFHNSSGLTSVTNLSTTPQSISSETFTKYGTLHVLPGCKKAYQNADYWKNFTIVEDAIDPYPIELADGKTYNGATTQENKEISYTRTFNNTSWQSLYIPFSMTYDDWKDDFEVAYINGIRQMDTDDDGAIDETIMDVVKIKSGSLIPNTPYLIRAKNTGNKTITVNNVTLYKAESNSVDCSTTIAKYTFTGTYSTIPAATLLANNYYAMGGGSLIMTDGTSDLKPYRWYLNVESRSPMYNVSSGAKAITINVVGEEEATGISQMTSDREPSSAIYDLNGRKMSQKTLKSGLYIKNGKKVFIK